MEIIKNKKGTSIRARVYLKGRSYSQVFRSKREAIAWQAKMKLDFKSGHTQPQPVNKLLKEAATDWYSQKVATYLSRKTQVSYRGSVQNYVVPLLGDEFIGSIRKSHAEVFVKLLFEEGLGPRTVNRHLFVFKQIMKFCCEHEWILKNPLLGVKEIQKAENAFDFLSREEINRLLVVNLHEPIYVVLLIALNTGMRLGEICGLCWDQVSFQSRQIVVRRTMSSYGLEEKTKSKRIRYVPMNDQVYDCLLKLSHKKKTVFVCSTGRGVTWNVDHVSGRGFRRALERADVRKVRFHDLRHTYASHFMMNNGNIYDLQKILGHADMKMTMRYAHQSPDHLLSAANIVSFNGEEKSNLPKTAHGIFQIFKS